MKLRWKVACINWSHPTAPHAVAYLLDDELMIFDRFFPNHSEAIAYADSFARKETK